MGIRYAKFLHPEKKMPVYVNVYNVSSIEPFVFSQLVVDDDIFQKVEAGEMSQEEATKDHAKLVHDFRYTIITLTNKKEISVRERPHIVMARIADEICDD